MDLCSALHTSINEFHNPSLVFFFFAYRVSSPLTQSFLYIRDLCAVLITAKSFEQPSILPFRMMPSSDPALARHKKYKGRRAARWLDFEELRQTQELIRSKDTKSRVALERYVVWALPHRVSIYIGNKRIGEGFTAIDAWQQATIEEILKTRCRLSYTIHEEIVFWLGQMLLYEIDLPFDDVARSKDLVRLLRQKIAQAMAAGPLRLAENLQWYETRSQKEKEREIERAYYQLLAVAQIDQSKDTALDGAQE